jgi:hypothetical protein
MNVLLLYYQTTWNYHENEGSVQRSVLGHFIEHAIRNVTSFTLSEIAWLLLSHLYM